MRNIELDVAEQVSHRRRELERRRYELELRKLATEEEKFEREMARGGWFWR